MRRLLLTLALAACTGGPKTRDSGADSGTSGAGDPDPGDTDAPGGEPDCDLVVFEFEGAIVTVSGAPFGLEIPLETPISGTLGYKPCLRNVYPVEGFGEYRHRGSSVFEASFAGHDVRGSGKAHVEVAPATSTWRFVDGWEAIPDDEWGERSMSLDGVDLPRMKLWIATGPDDGSSFPDASIPEPDWLDPEAPHTFSLEDDQGTALTQWTVFQVRP